MTDIRSPSQTIIYGSGILNRIKLQLNDEQDIIRGHISIRTYENDIVSFRVFQKKVTSRGKINPSFKSMKTVMESYKDCSMVDDSSKADVVCIKESKNKQFPNAKIYVTTKYDMNSVKSNTSKSVNFISRIKDHNINQHKMIFKVYGCYVEEIYKETIKCRIIDHNYNAVQINLHSKNNEDLTIGQVIDVAGYIREGLNNGESVCDYIIRNFRESVDYTKDMFKEGINNYKNYIEELSKDSPF